MVSTTSFVVNHDLQKIVDGATTKTEVTFVQILETEDESLKNAVCAIHEFIDQEDLPEGAECGAVTVILPNGEISEPIPQFSLGLTEAVLKVTEPVPLEGVEVGDLLGLFYFDDHEKGSDTQLYEVISQKGVSYGVVK